ncbi:MAG TPA: peptide chain release factor 3 [Magnetococcales bacterium]|nr:peptide chain release factor 3 [Magnetococcales bacterium]
MKDHPPVFGNRRTFAIIAHPDAGKTTLTEKLLLFGGAIQMAGRVKARGQARRARSDWMKVERERGISVTASVMTFEHDGKVFNLLDTPGHEDFSEDTYRTLTAVDTAVMVLDAAKGIEAQTLKLFEVCRLRNVPIITFINKLDRDGRSPFELLDEIENQLALEVTPASWPIGMGREFLGCYDLLHDRLMFMKRGDGSELQEAVPCQGLNDPVLGALLPAQAWATMREEVLMTRELCPAFDVASFLRGDLSPVFFGSAVNNFGVRELLWGLATMASPPRPQPARERRVDPGEDKVTGFVFKIQANMDLKHRDRIAFIRLCSGHFRRGMKLTHQRTGKSLNVHNPMIFLARERETAEEAWAGDIIGVPNHGVLRIGDTLTEGENLKFTGVPSFAPEMLRRIRPDDPMRTKHLGKTLIQLGEEGAARVFKTRFGSDWIVGVLGALQFEVLADRIRTEYEMVVHFESTPFYTARWVDGDDLVKIKNFADANTMDMAEDHDGLPVYLARNAWRLDNAAKEWPHLRFLSTREQL